ncbi:MAG: hypothetical protein KF685_00375 [Acidobacteria bacterium]|nr:hypothetical protein [Acidobacteriota bacterium]
MSGQKTKVETLPVIVSPAVSDDPCNYPQPTDRLLTAEEAVVAAECFVIQNGYTDLPPIADRSKIVPENIYPMTDDEGMRLRRDSLQRRAFSFSQDHEFFGGSWVVMFAFKPHQNVVRRSDDGFDNFGRAVVMDFYGRNIRILHSPYSLRSPNAKIMRPSN